MQTVTQVKLVITDRFSVHHLNDICKENIIKRITADEARWSIHISKSYKAGFHIKSDFCKNICENILECEIQNNDEENLPKLDHETNFLVISIDDNINPVFHLIA